MERLGKTLCLFEVRLGSLTPDHVRIGSIDQTTRDRRFDTAPKSQEAIAGALTGQKFNVTDVAVGGKQLGAVGVGAGNQNCRYTADISRKAGRNELAYKFCCRNKHLATHVSALFSRCQLVFKMDGGCSGFDHRLHQLEGVEA